MEERLYTVPLVGAYDKPATKRAKYSVKVLRSFVSKHMKSKNINVSEMINKAIWSHSISKPPRRIKVKMIKKDDVVYVLLPDEKLKGNKKEEKSKGKKKDEKKDKKVADKKDKKKDNKVKEKKQTNEKPKPKEQNENKATKGESTQEKKDKQ